MPPDIPTFPPRWKEWRPCEPPKPPIPVWLYRDIRGAVPFRREVKRLQPERPKPEEVKRIG